MLLSWIRRPFHREVKLIRRPRPVADRTANRFRPGIKGLEDRAVPAFLAPAILHAVKTVSSP